MIDKLAKLEKEFNNALDNVDTAEAARELKIRYLGRKGPFNDLLKGLSELSGAERGVAGKEINTLKKRVDSLIEGRLGELEAAAADSKLARESIDVSLPGRRSPMGALHPVTQITDEIEQVFLSLGFDIAEGPEIESDYYNFEALNIPKDHPARDMQDTFYISDDQLLRTHTSPVQIRVMEGTEPPLRIIAPGAVYRRDSDVTHTPMFHQIEGFMVDTDVTFADLKGVLTLFLTKLFGKKTPVRFRPSFFPFTEPSAEVDIGCVICNAKGECRVCRSTGWLEILGSGMIDPEVFTHIGYDPEIYTGFAFGLGIERIAMLKYGIDDLRLFFENDLRFLKQF